MAAIATDARFDASLTKTLGECAFYPERYAEFAFPWGRPGRLRYKQLRTWQRDYLRDLGELVRSRNFHLRDNPSVEPVFMAVASGHGIGKSALSAMTGKWVIDCWPESRGLITANTATQLKSRTWAAMGEWHRMSVTRNRSVYLASRGNMRLFNKEFPESWDIVAYTAAKEQSEAMQGQHSPTVSMFLADEASALPPEILSAVKGAMVGGLGLFLLSGNPTRNSGPLYDAFHRDRGNWNLRKINSMTVEDTDSPMLKRWVDEYGWDSDFVRVRVRGEFPMSSDLQFIPGVDVERGMYHFTYEPELTDPLIYGCDVAHTGSDNSVLIKRRGAKVVEILASPNWDVNQFGDLIMNQAILEQPDAIFVDEGGVGAGMPGLLRRSLDVRVVGVNAAMRSPDPKCSNMTAYCWYTLREALRAGLDLPLPKDSKWANELHDDLIQREAGFRISDNAIVLERKDEARKRGIASPDFGDALSLTYAHPVRHRPVSKPQLGERGGITYAEHVQTTHDWRTGLRRPEHSGMTSVLSGGWRK